MCLEFGLGVLCYIPSYVRSMQGVTAQPDILESKAKSVQLLEILISRIEYLSCRKSIVHFCKVGRDRSQHNRDFIGKPAKMA